MKNQRILFITPGLTKGGAETQLMKVARFLKTQQKEVTILALKPLNDFDIKRDNIPVVFLKSWGRYFFSNIYQLFVIVKRVKPDVVVAFMFIAIIFARILKLRYKFHLISSIRNSAISKKWRKLFQLTAGLDDLVVYNSKTSQFNFEEQRLVRKRGVIINNAITIPVLGQPKAVEILPDPFVWITMAHFRPSKDYATLFKAIALIKNENFRIDVLGHIKNQIWPYEMIKQLQIENRVRLLGFKNNATDYLKEADAFVLSSFWEGSPNAMLEAMAYGKPIIGSAVDGIEELLKEVNCGFLFKQGDENELAKKMMQMMQMPFQQRLYLGLVGRKYVEENFAEEQVMDRWLQTVS